MVPQRTKKIFCPSSFQIRVPNGSLQTNRLRRELRLLHGYAKDLMEAHKTFWIWQFFFLNIRLIALRPNMGHWWGGSLTHLMLITSLFILIDPKITKSFPRRLGPEAQSNASVGLRLETFQYRVDSLFQCATLSTMLHNFLCNGRINLTENKSLLRNSSNIILFPSCIITQF